MRKNHSASRAATAKQWEFMLTAEQFYSCALRANHLIKEINKENTQVPQVVVEDLEPSVMMISPPKMVKQRLSSEEAVQQIAEIIKGTVNYRTLAAEVLIRTGIEMCVSVAH